MCQMLLQGRVRDFPTRFGKTDVFGNPEKRDVGVVGRTESLRSGMKRKQLSLKPQVSPTSVPLQMLRSLKHIPMDTQTSLMPRSDPPSLREAYNKRPPY